MTPTSPSTRRHCPDRVPDRHPGWGYFADLPHAGLAHGEQERPVTRCIPRTRPRHGLQSTTRSRCGIRQHKIGICGNALSLRPPYTPLK